ncbi:MAG: glycosyltransferase family 4 protein [Caldilineales bacterium]|nr:glycosyltransferase family 4 protein [Caldilineales bacterium]
MSTRVAHIITRFHGAGGAKNTLFTCKGLVAAGYEVDLVVGASADAWRAEGSGVRWVQIPSLRRSIHPLHDARATRDLLHLFRQRQYSIVHTHLAKAGILGRWAARRAGTPILIHSLHGATFSPVQPALTHAFYLALEKIAAPWTDRIVPVGEDLRQRYLAAGVGRPEQYEIIHSGMDLAAFLAAGQAKAAHRARIRSAFGLDENHFLAGYVAALEWRKGHHFLIEMLRDVAPHHPHLRLLFAGEGFDRARIEALTQAAGVSDRVIFSGYRTDIAEVMAACDVKLFASEREGLPQVLVQAAAVGLPVLAFAAEGVAELVHEGCNGHIYRHGDIAALARGLEALIAHPARRQQMAAYGPGLVDERWTIQTMQNKTLSLYLRLLEEKTR